MPPRRKESDPIEYSIDDINAHSIISFAIAEQRNSIEAWVGRGYIDANSNRRKPTTDDLDYIQESGGKDAVSAYLEGYKMFDRKLLADTHKDRSIEILQVLDILLNK